MQGQNNHTENQAQYKLYCHAKGFQTSRRCTVFLQAQIEHVVLLMARTEVTDCTVDTHCWAQKNMQMTCEQICMPMQSTNDATLFSHVFLSEQQYRTERNNAHLAPGAVTKQQCYSNPQRHSGLKRVDPSCKIHSKPFKITNH